MFSIWYLCGLTNIPTSYELASARVQVVLLNIKIRQVVRQQLWGKEADFILPSYC